MRLIRTKIYRAFPELDRFDDEQCRRFVVAANSSWRRRLGRWAVVGVTTAVMVVAGIAGAVVLAAWMDERMMMNGTIGYFGWAVLLVIGSGLGLLGGLVLRDRILRLRVRQLIRRCGSCPKCHYSLLGIRVGAENVIVCPECGTKVIADPAMGELTTDESGAAVYKPEVVRIDALAKERRRRRHRAVIKWGAVGTAGAIVLLVVGAGGWWMFLKAQARRAVAERDTVERVRGIQETMWPVGGADPSEEFERFCAMVGAASAATQLKRTEESAALVAVYFEAATLREDADDIAFDKKEGKGAFAACRAYTLACMEKAREDGIGVRLRGLLDLKRPMRTMAPPAGDPFLMVTATELGPARGMARFNQARMVLARQAGDRREYIHAMEEALGGAQIVERQGLIIDRLVGAAMRALVQRQISEDAPKIADSAWLKEMVATMERWGARPPLSKSLEVERVGGLDAVQWFFGEPDRVAKAQLGVGGSAALGMWGATRGAIGTYEGNKAAWNSMYAAYIAAADVEDQTKRPAVPTAPTGYAVIDTMAPALGMLFQSDDRLEYERRVSLLTVGAEAYRRTHGESPRSPDELAGIVADPKAGIDPGCGKPFKFIVREASGKDGKAFEIRDGDWEGNASGKTNAVGGQ